MLDLVSSTTSLASRFREEVLRGLAGFPKSLPSRWLYDEQGCLLFEEITRLPEYYPSRTEIAILRRHAHAIGSFLRPGVLIEYGAGAGIKSETVLRAAGSQVFVPVDIAGDFLEATAARLRQSLPGLLTIPVTADFTTDFSLPYGLGGPRSIFFPGSTIGNLDSLETHELLERMREHADSDGRAVIGVDLKKDLDRLIPAYDDARGVTAAFNLNLLARINRELGGTFDPAAFGHEARWNPTDDAIEMHLVSTANQTVEVAGVAFRFHIGETIHTESSRKYDVPGFALLAERAGWRCERIWSDPGAHFALFGLSV